MYKTFAYAAFSLLLVLFATVADVCAQKQTSGREKIWISFYLKKHQKCTIYYDDAFFETQALEFNNTGNSDSVIVKSIDTNQPLSWNYGVYNSAQKGNWQIMQYVFVATPGDTVRLSYQEVPFLNTGRCGISLVTNDEHSFYSEQKQIYGPTPLPRKEAWRIFINAFKRKYKAENARIDSLLSNSGITPSHHRRLLLISKMHYYKKIADWAWIKDGEYFRPAIDTLIDNIPNIRKLLEDPDIFSMHDLLEVVDTYVRINLIKKRIDVNSTNIYTEAAANLLGNFKSAYLTVCLLKSPVKIGDAFNSIKSDFTTRYKNTVYLTHVETALKKLTETKIFPMNSRFATVNGITSSAEDVIKGSKIITVIDFWASWCVPCRQQLPYLDSVKQKLSDLPIRFISINLDDKPQNWKSASQVERRYLKENNFRLINTGKQAFVKELNITSIPRYMILRGKEIVATDFYQPTDPSFEKALRTIIEEKPR